MDQISVQKDTQHRKCFIRRVGYVVVVVHDWSGALDFYGDTLGLELTRSGVEIFRGASLLSLSVRAAREDSSEIPGRVAL